MRTTLPSPNRTSATLDLVEEEGAGCWLVTSIGVVKNTTREMQLRMEVLLVKMKSAEKSLVNATNDFLKLIIRFWQKHANLFQGIRQYGRTIDKLIKIDYIINNFFQ